MKNLLNNRFVPLTYQIGFLEAPFEDVMKVFLRWQSEIGQGVGRTPSSEITNVSLPKALSLLQPLTTPPTKVLLVATDSRWTAYFDNGLRISDPESAVGHLCTIMPCKGAVAHCVPDRSYTTHPDAIRTFGAVALRLFSSRKTDWLNQERAIVAMNDGGHWIFSAEGLQQPFEESRSYDSPQISDRFTCDMLDRYCEALGIRIFDDSFYLKKAAMIRTIQKLPPGAPRMSIEEARRCALLDLKN